MKQEAEKAFEKIIREHRATIYTVCYMFSQDADEVADLFQEVLIHLWKGWNTFREESSLNTWIWRISLNTCISMDRKKKKFRNTIPLTMDIDLFEDQDEDSWQIRKLRERIHTLPFFDRALILLWLEDLSYDEISTILGISAKNVSARLIRIKTRLLNAHNSQNDGK